MALAKNGSFGFAKGRLAGGVKAKCATCGLAKIVFKKCGWEKIKNTRSAMSVGLLRSLVSHHLQTRKSPSQSRNSPSADS